MDLCRVLVGVEGWMDGSAQGVGGRKGTLAWGTCWSRLLIQLVVGSEPPLCLLPTPAPALWWRGRPCSDLLVVP